MFITVRKFYKMEALLNYYDKTIIILAKKSKLNSLSPFTVIDADPYCTSKSAFLALNDVFLKGTFQI